MRAIAVAGLLVLVTAATAQDPSVPLPPVQGPPLQEPKPATIQFEAGYDDGFYLRSMDGQYEVVLGGLLQVGANFFQANRSRDSEFDLRRMRPELSGRLGKVLRFRLEPNFGDDDVEMEEAWVGVDLCEGSSRLLFGRMKVPFSLEEVRSRTYIDFPRFSILNQFVPAEEDGVFLLGTLADGFWEYGLAGYNGTGGSDTNSDTDFAARLMVHPFVHDEGSMWQNLQLGVAATWGRQDQGVAGETINNAADQPVIEFATDTRLDGTRSRLGLEFAWFHGPFMVQSEAMWIRQEMENLGTTDRVQINGVYVDLSWVVTGEAKSFGAIKPDRPVDLETMKGSGAWVLALRLSDLRADDSLRNLGFTVPGRFTTHIRSVSVGLNWVINQHALVRHAYVHSFYSDDVLLGSSLHDNEGALMIEWQLHF